MIEIYAKITYISYWFWYSVLLNIVHNFTSFHVTDGTFVINNTFFKKMYCFPIILFQYWSLIVHQKEIHKQIRCISM